MSGELNQVFLNLIVKCRNTPSGRRSGQGCLHRAKSRFSTAATDQAGLASSITDRTAAASRQRTWIKVFDPFFTTKPVGLGTGPRVARDSHASIRNGEAPAAGIEVHTGAIGSGYHPLRFTCPYTADTSTAEGVVEKAHSILWTTSSSPRRACEMRLHRMKHESGTWCFVVSGEAASDRGGKMQETTPTTSLSPTCTLPAMERRPGCWQIVNGALAGKRSAIIIVGFCRGPGMRPYGWIPLCPSVPEQNPGQPQQLENVIDRCLLLHDLLNQTGICAHWSGRHPLRCPPCLESIRLCRVIVSDENVTLGAGVPRRTRGPRNSRPWRRALVCRSSILRSFRLARAHFSSVEQARGGYLGIPGRSATWRLSVGESFPRWPGREPAAGIDLEKTGRKQRACRHRRGQTRSYTRRRDWRMTPCSPALPCYMTFGYWVAGTGSGPQDLGARHTDGRIRGPYPCVPGGDRAVIRRINKPKIRRLPARDLGVTSSGRGRPWRINHQA